MTWETVEAFQVCDCLSCWSDRKCLQWIWRHLRHPCRGRGGVTENTSQLGGWEKIHMNRLNGFWSSWSQTQAWGSPSTKRVCEAGSYPWGLLQREERRLLDFGWCTEQRDSLLVKKRHFWLCYGYGYDYCKNCSVFFWRSCFGGQPTWHEHRFGYVNSVCTPLSSVFILENAQLYKSLLLQAQRLALWGLCLDWNAFFSGYPLHTDSMKLWDMRPTRRSCPIPRHQDHIQL